MQPANGVRDCLHAGIAHKMHVLRVAFHTFDGRAIEIYMKQITEALAWYKIEFGSAATVHLDIEYAQLAAMVRDRPVVLKGVKPI